MTTIHLDSNMTDQERRLRLYAGDIFVFSPTRRSEKFCQFAREMVTSAFGDEEPETAQHRREVNDYIRVLKQLKPEFIHHEASKKHLRNILTDLNFDLNETYFDVPRLRSSTSNGYLTSGLAYAWHPHRDTWYSSPAVQINHWIPIWDITDENTVAFHPLYFNENIPNDSSRYNYYEWNAKHRYAASAQMKTDERPLPGPNDDVELDSQLKVVCPVGGMILFSAAQLHSSVPNTSGRTRFSIDFRTVNVSDIKNDRGAPMVDVRCTGSSIRDFRRASDSSEMPVQIVDLFNDGTESSGSLVYSPSDSVGS